MLLFDQRPIQAIVCDIEGTTTDIAFVKEVLFPYASERLQTFIQEIGPTPAGQEILAQVRVEMGDPDLTLEAATAQLLAWAAADRKVTPLKAVQGMIWEEGYRQGVYTSHLYPDAVTALQDWHRRGVPLYIYSSGSIAAQKLLFAHTIAGDLTPCFQGYFDTTTGPKTAAASYGKIAVALATPPAQLLFLSDHPAELDAAHQAGWQVCGLRRPGTPELPPRWPVVETFDQLPLRFTP